MILAMRHVAPTLEERHAKARRREDENVRLRGFAASREAFVNDEPHLPPPRSHALSGLLMSRWSVTQGCAALHPGLSNHARTGLSGQHFYRRCITREQQL
jgi:hypothetical protein